MHLYIYIYKCFVNPFYFMYRLLSLPKSSGCQRCRHGSMWLVQESLQISLSSLLGKYSFIPIAVSIRIVHKDHLLIIVMCCSDREMGHAEGRWNISRKDLKMSPQHCIRRTEVISSHLSRAGPYQCSSKTTAVIINVIPDVLNLH